MPAPEFHKPSPATLPGDSQRIALSNGQFVPADEFEFLVSKSSGPGGQNVNKVNSRIQLRWKVSANRTPSEEVRTRLLALAGSRLTTDGELMITGQQFRDAPKNKADCIAKLTELLERALVRPKKRRPTKPSRAAKARRLADKKHRSQQKSSRRKTHEE